MSKARQIANLLADLDNVATSGEYADLQNQPTANTAFTNDAGYITSAALPTATSELTNDSDFATNAYVNQQVSDLVESAPAALDTLNELAAAIGDDANFSTTITNSIGTKAAQTSLDSTNSAATALAARVTTEEGNVDALQSEQSSQGSRLTAIEAQYRATVEHTAVGAEASFVIGSLTSAPTDVECFMNGIRLFSSDFTGAFSGSAYTITLGEATVAGDVLEIVAWKI